MEVNDSCASWTIEAFLDICEDGTYSSPVFSLRTLGDGELCRVVMWPYGCGEDLEYVSILLNRTRGVVGLGRIICQVSSSKSGHLSHQGPAKPIMMDCFTTRVYRLIHRAQVEGLLMNGKLQIHVMLWKQGDAIPVCPHPTLEDRQAELSDNLRATSAQNLAELVKISQLSENDPHSYVFKTWREDREFADATVKVEDLEFKIHKLVYASRSRVFDRMLRHNMSDPESNVGCIVLTDISPEVFARLDEYMYAGTVTDLNNFAADLLDAAEKYELEQLKCVCEASLLSTISIDTVLEVLALGDLYGIPRLKTTALEFIKKHANSVTASDLWMTFLASKPLLATEVFRYLASTQNPFIAQ